MRQTTELSRVKARIKALAEKTVSNGCTEAEAMAAAEMVGRLLERYALSMEEIDVRENAASRSRCRSAASNDVRSMAVSRRLRASATARDRGSDLIRIGRPVTTADARQLGLGRWTVYREEVTGAGVRRLPQPRPPFVHEKFCVVI